MKTFILFSAFLFSIVAEASIFGRDVMNLNPKFNQKLNKLESHKPSSTKGRARITLLDTGRIVTKKHGNGNDQEYVPTISLIEDGANKIIFDTGLATDDGSFKRMIDALTKLKLKPNNINKVILSHGHLDHLGHADAFKKAKIYHGDHVFDGFSLTYIGTYEFGGYNVTENVKIVPTPGLTSTCITAVINNAETLNSRSDPIELGIVAITGDLFFKVEDLTNDSLWKSSSTNIRQQNESRKSIMCEVDYITPGHGPMFKVPEKHKKECKKAFEKSLINRII